MAGSDRSSHALKLSIRVACTHHLVAGKDTAACNNTHGPNSQHISIPPQVAERAIATSCDDVACVLVRKYTDILLCAHLYICKHSVAKTLKKRTTQRQSAPPQVYTA